jgi:[ribosomal protein S5]-alanine N-acetyltransferase
MTASSGRNENFTPLDTLQNLTGKRHELTKMIEGERVFLRPPREEDQEEYLAVNRRSASLNRGLASPPTEPEQFAALLNRCRGNADVCFFVCRRTDGAILGTITLSQIYGGGFQSAYLGYQIGADFAGQGYMTEALTLALHYAFAELKLHRLEANIQPGNVPSIALVKRAGFVQEGFSRKYLKICGRWRDHERWAILVDDWSHKRAQAGTKTEDACLK